MHIFDSYEIVDKLNSKILWTAAIMGLFTAASAIWNAVKESKYSKIISITLATLTSITAFIGVYFGDHLSDLQKQKEQKHLNRLANFSSAITKSASSNKILENRVKDASEKLKLNLRPIKRVDASASNKIELLPASGTMTYVKTDNSANKVIITPSVAGQTISGWQDSYELELQNSNITLELSGTDWVIK